MWYCGYVKGALLLSVLASLAFPARGFGQALTDQQIIERFIQESREAYYSTGHPCACPYDHARDGSACGARSAYTRPGGAEPKCYPKDITNADIEAYRTQHR
jgi:hypothetical protein